MSQIMNICPKLVTGFCSYDKEGRIATPQILLACIFAKGGWTCLIVGDGFNWSHHPAAWHFFLVALWPLDNSSYPPLLLPHTPTGMAVIANPSFRRLLKAGNDPAVLDGSSEVFSLPLQGRRVPSQNLQSRWFSPLTVAAPIRLLQPNNMHRT